MEKGIVTIRSTNWPRGVFYHPWYGFEGVQHPLVFTKSYWILPHAERSSPSICIH